MKIKCPQHMLAPKDRLEMIPNLDEAHTGKRPKFYALYSKVNQVFYSSPEQVNEILRSKLS